MTDEQINAAIAEACGWTEVGECENGGFRLRGFPSDRFESHRKPIPNYCTDLNAMHEAESTLTDDQRSIFYPRFLGGYMCPVAPMYATARQRAEAFLRTLEKWEDGK